MSSVVLRQMAQVNSTKTNLSAIDNPPEVIIKRNYVEKINETKCMSILTSVN